MESRQERIEKRQERIERMLERMERNLERMERKLENIEKTQSRIERQTADIPLSDYSDYLDASDDDGVSIGGLATSATGSGAYDTRRHDGNRVYRPRRRNEGDGTLPGGNHRRPYSMSSAPSRYPPEVYYTISDQPPLLTPGYRRSGYEAGEPTIVINSQMGESADRPARSHRDDRRTHRRGRRHGSDDDLVSPARIRRDEWVKKKSDEPPRNPLSEDTQDRWRTVQPNPDPKPDFIRPSTFRGDPGLLEDEDEY